MPETYIVYRYFFEDIGITEMWRKSFISLTEKEKIKILPIIESNDFRNIDEITTSKKLKELFRHYTIRREDVKVEDENYKLIKSQFQKLIKQDQFIDLTLTYDFENKNLRKLHRVVI